MAELSQHFAPRRYLTKEPVIIALLFAGAIAGFGAVSALSALYHSQQRSLASYWFNKGNADLLQHNYQRAVQEFHVALLYSRDNYDFRLNLAEALVGLGHIDEASTYFNNLWERQPENGLVNLELARIAVRNKNLEQALRYYHNAIYGVWPPEKEPMRRQTRLELIDYLLSINAKRQAQSELIALAATLGNEPGPRQRLGDLFLRVQDYPDALSAYRTVLRTQPRNAAALAGAAQASFDLGRYADAQRYLRAALAQSPNNTSLATLRKTTELVLQLDPFRRGLSLAQRNRIVVEDFQTVGRRLQTCMPSTGLTQPSPAERNLPDTWEKLKPRITVRGLLRDPSLVETTMDLIFDIERQTSITCGEPTGPDMALLLIAKLHEGS
jgi:tetratricopeptide (TPR) repeat protein